ncbi:MAG: chromosome segregation protein SMC, partial [Nitrospinota bacterium]
GKSNLGDAIRWVLGEQNPRLLRARRMEDLLFNGSEARKSVGMAEVSLTLGDLNGALAHPPWGAGDEVAVTRRLYRSGESEYLINRVPCRLKDIVDIFLDTGVSTDSFTLVEQGKVETLIAARPQDRRVLIEEAAGIMKYKTRRAEALRKLERSEANLLRVRDIVLEVERQCRSLRRQANKAKFFKQYREEVLALEVDLMALDLWKLGGALWPLEEEFSSLRAKEGDLAAELAQLEARQEVARQAVADLTEGLGGARSLLSRGEAEVQRLEHRLELLAQQGRDLEEGDLRREEELGRFAAQEKELAAGLQEARRVADSLSTEVGEAREAYARQAARVESLRRELASREAALARAQHGRLEVAQEAAELRNRQGYVDSQRSHLARTAERLTRSLEEGERTRRHRDENARAAAAALARAEDQARATAHQEGAKAEALGSARREGREAEETLYAARGALAQTEAAIESLEAVLRGEGGEQFSAEDLRGMGTQGVVGELSSLLRAAPQHERALEAALGGRLRGVVLAGEGGLWEAARAFREKGRAPGWLFLPPGESATLPELPRGAAGFVGRASELVEAAPELSQLVEALLGSVAVAEDLLSAWALRVGPPRERAGKGVTWVTLDGEVVEPSGAVRAGRAQGAGALGQRRALAGLREEAGARREALQRCLARREETAERVARMEAELEEAQGGRRRAELERERCAAARAQAAEDLRRVEAELETRRFEAAETAREREALERAAGELASSLARCEEAAGRAEALLEEHGGTVARLRAELAEAEASATERKVNLAGAEAEAVHARREGERLGEELAQVSARRAREEAEREEARRRREALTFEQAGVREQLEAARTSVESLRADAAASGRRLEDAQREEALILHRLRELRGRVAPLQERLTSLAEQRAALRAQEEGLLARGQETLGVDLREMLPGVEALSPEEESLRSRVESLRERLRRMGDVNLLADREYQELSERRDFLRRQQEDLERSIRDLHETVERIDRTTRQRFQRAFEQVSETFSEIFGRLFAGGEARLFLTDPSDLLESGVDIEVRPPGKRPGNIMLLSAGEKALTAIALLFSVFRVRPSPFCLLDEVDATLDDANVVRFREVLQDFEEHTQFILVTHNKRTMAFAEDLYGITQREKGVSEVVSVRIQARQAAAG